MSGGRGAYGQLAHLLYRVLKIYFSARVARAVAPPERVRGAAAAHTRTSNTIVYYLLYRVRLFMSLALRPYGIWVFAGLWRRACVRARTSLETNVCGAQAGRGGAFRYLM